MLGVETPYFMPPPQQARVAIEHAETIEDWVAAVEKLPGILRFDAATMGYLARVMPRFDQGNDPYLVSPAYHAFTGRHGLWAYARGKAMVLLARHPQDPRMVMFYPQMGAAFPSLALELMERLPVPPGGYRMVRVPDEQADFMAASLNRKATHFIFTAETEYILDWTYPVHTIDTRAVMKAEGRKFKSFRQHLNTIDEARIRIEQLDPVGDRGELMGVIGPWAQSKADICPPEEMIDIYLSFLQVMSYAALDLRGVKYYLDGALVAFDAWAMPQAGSQTANSFAGFSKTKIRGFSEFQHLTFCRLLAAENVERVCLGGSELEGLDSFKRKMNPVESIALRSLAVRVK